MRRGLALDVSSELPLPKEQRERKKEKELFKNCSEDAEGEEGLLGPDAAFGCHQLLKPGGGGKAPIHWKSSLDEQVTTRRLS